MNMGKQLDPVKSFCDISNKVSHLLRSHATHPEPSVSFK